MHHMIINFNESRRESGAAGWMARAMDDRRAYFESDSDEGDDDSSLDSDWEE